jgi:hypothetical protein
LHFTPTAKLQSAETLGFGKLCSLPKKPLQSLKVAEMLGFLILARQKLHQVVGFAKCKAPCKPLISLLCSFAALCTP